MTNKKIFQFCDEELQQHISLNLRNFTIKQNEASDMRHAAVAVTIVEAGYGPDVYGMPMVSSWSDAPALVLTRRASKLHNHSGQWAFPGGHIDAGEEPEDAALRELSEEVGLALDRSHVLGRLDDFTTRSGFIMSPVVIWGGSRADLVPNPAEVSSIHRIPVFELMRRDAPILQKSSDSENPILLMPVGNSWIAAPTGAIIYQFREVAMLGRDVRVAHYEQPFFAWK